MKKEELLNKTQITIRFEDTNGSKYTTSREVDVDFEFSKTKKEFLDLIEEMIKSVNSPQIDSVVHAKIEMGF